tara:strand:- start:804 stop:929 length:126 start_codon:yes stop_codon:yes gene_type:complete
MSSKFFGNKHTKTESTQDKGGKASSKGKGANKQVKKVGRGK